jgi:antitoxin (DNA-binding transcriptional repressor) of toxin-antitoxin stability system
MKLVNIHEAKTNLSALITDLETKEESILICRHGKPVAELRKAVTSRQNPLKQHPALSKGKFLYDPVAPLDEDEWPEN